jgi:hypothetical protein
MRNGLVITVLALALAAGCVPLRPAPLAPVPPPLEMEKVVAAHNAWAASIQHLWSRADITVNLPGVEDSSDRQTYNVEGHLFVVKPDNLLLRGQILGQEVFQVGMNVERFWMILKPKVNRAWTGRRGGPGERRFTLAAADLMTALGYYEVRPDARDPGAFRIDREQYILTEFHTVAGNRVPWRRTWFDRRTLRPVRIDGFDIIGQPILMSEILACEADGSTPVCTVYRIRLFADDEVDVTLRLSAVSLSKTVAPSVFTFRPSSDARIDDLDGRSPDASAE